MGYETQKGEEWPAGWGGSPGVISTCGRDGGYHHLWGGRPPRKLGGLPPRRPGSWSGSWPPMQCDRANIDRGRAFEGGQTQAPTSFPGNARKDGVRLSRRGLEQNGPERGGRVPSTTNWACRSDATQRSPSAVDLWIMPPAPRRRGQGVRRGAKQPERPRAA